MIGVKRGTAGHGQDLARRGPDDKDVQIFGLELLHETVGFLFDDVLDALVNRQHHVVAVAGGPVGKAEVGNFPPFGVADDPALAGHALQVAVHGFFDAALPDFKADRAIRSHRLVAKVDEAEDLGGFRAVRVVADRLTLEPDRAELGGAKLALQFGTHAVGDFLVAVLWIDLAAQPFGGNAQQVGQHRQFLRTFGENLSIEADLDLRDALGENASAHVEDGTALGRDGFPAGVETDRLLPVLLLLHQLDPDQLDGDSREGHRQSDRDGEDPETGIHRLASRAISAGTGRRAGASTISS